MKTIFNRKTFIYGTFLFAILTCIIIAVKRPPGSDAYYYIGVSRLINDGLTPFKDFNLGYTPLSFYIMSLPIKWFGYSAGLVSGIMFMIYAINTYLLYKLLNNYTENKDLIIFCLLYYFLSLFILDGRSYLLEMHVTFWGLLALMLIIKNNYITIIAAGICCFCSFFCKQYGLGYICLCAVFLIFSKSSIKNTILKTTVLFASFFIAATAAYIFFKFQGVDLITNWSQLSGSSYASAHFGLIGIYGLLIGFALVLLLFPAFGLGIWFYIKNFRILKHNAILSVSLLGTIGFMLQFFIRPFPHYMQLATPMIIIFAAIMLDKYLLPKKNRLCKLCVITMLIPILLVAVIDIRSFTKNESEKTNELAATIEKEIPKNSKLVYLSHDFLSVGLINNYMPPCLKQYGMSNGFSYKGFGDFIRNANYCVMSEEWLKSSINGHPEDAKYLNEHFKIADEDKSLNYIIYRRK